MLANLFANRADDASRWLALQRDDLANDEVLQRALTKDTAFEIRYIGNRSHHPWGAEDWNTVDWLNNGLFDEFRLAQVNLLANVQAGRGATFASPAL